MKLFNKYKFSDKSQTLGGMISTVMGLAAMVAFGYGIYIAFLANGNAGLSGGELGLAKFILCFIGGSYVHLTMPKIREVESLRVAG